MTQRPAGDPVGLQRVEVPVTAPDGGDGVSPAGVGDLKGVYKIIVSPVTERAVVLFDSGTIGVEDVLRAFAGGRADIGRLPIRWQLPIPRLTCAKCAGRLEDAVEGVPGVRAAVMNGASGSLMIEFMVGQTDLGVVRSTLSTQGYGPESHARPASTARGECHASEH